MESPEYRPLSVKSTEMTLLAKWDLVEEKAGLECRRKIAVNKSGLKVMKRVQNTARLEISLS